MGVRVIAGEDYGCMYDSVTMQAFGPMFSHEDTFGSPGEAVQDFINWFYLRRPGDDPRHRTNVDLVADRRLWLRERCGHPPATSYRKDTFTNDEAGAATFERMRNE